MSTHLAKGGCHCGAVRFSVQFDLPLTLYACNCSICQMTGFLHMIVPGDHFTLEQGEGVLSSYTFNTNVARHLFCNTCGVKSYYVPRSNPNGFSINARCLDGSMMLLSSTHVSVEPFDGQNWEDNADSLKGLT